MNFLRSRVRRDLSVQKVSYFIVLVEKNSSLVMKITGVYT